jgi:TfoX/Sxy family transcriptional regulator of competence genes
MATDEELTARLRTYLTSIEEWDTIEERRIVGGIGFFWHGHLTCGVMGADLLVRIAEEHYEQVIGDDGAAPMVMGGRSSRSWILVSGASASRDAVMATWVERAVHYVGSLPAR